MRWRRCKLKLLRGHDKTMRIEAIPDNFRCACSSSVGSVEAQDIIIVSCDRTGWVLRDIPWGRDRL